MKINAKPSPVYFFNEMLKIKSTNFNLQECDSEDIEAE